MFNSRWLSVALMTVLFISEVVLANKDGIYLGGTASTANLNVEYNKPVSLVYDSPGNSRLVDTEVGEANDQVRVFTAFGGYCFDLGDGYNFKVEASFSRYGDSLRGNVRETRNVYDPYDEWFFEREWGYGITLRMGTYFQTLSGEFYLLAGLGRLDARAGTDAGFIRFSTVDPPGREGRELKLDTGILEYEKTLTTWSFGIGFERTLNEDLGLRIEYRRMTMEDFEWTTPFEVEGRSFRSVEQFPATESSLLLGLSWYLQ